RILWLMVLMLPMQLGCTAYLSLLMKRYTRPLTAADLTRESVRSRLKIEGTIMMFMIVGGYILVVYFLRAEEQRVRGPMAEVRLAREVHRRLVPEIARRIGGGESFGRFLANGPGGGGAGGGGPKRENPVCYVGRGFGPRGPAGVVRWCGEN